MKSFLNLPPTLLASVFAFALAYAAPAPSPSTLILLPRTPDNATFCSSHHPALHNAITKLCNLPASTLTIGNKFVPSRSDPEYDKLPHRAEVIVQGGCGKEAEDVSQICWDVMWALCRARVESDGPVAANGGRRDCLQFFVSGHDEAKMLTGVSWDRLTVVQKAELGPGDSEAILAPLSTPAASLMPSGGRSMPTSTRSTTVSSSDQGRALISKTSSRRSSTTDVVLLSTSRDSRSTFETTTQTITVVDPVTLPATTVWPVSAR